MPSLGSNFKKRKDAESTDLSSLLNVLEWLNNTGFLGKTRVNVDHVRKLRSEVRNTWAHASRQELTDDKKNEGFSIAFDFLGDLEKAFPNAENRTCLEDLEQLKEKRVTNVAECELKSLVLQRHMLTDIKEEILRMKVEHQSNNIATKEDQQKLLKQVEDALHGCSQRMTAFENFKENISEQFNSFAEELKSFRTIPKDIKEIRNDISQIRDDLADMNERQKQEREPTSYLPRKSPFFTARNAEINKVIKTLGDEERALVSLHGGPGFGKTAIAIELAHKLDEDSNILVVFSDLTAAKTIDEMIRQLCLDAGVNYEDDPRPSLIFKLKNIKQKVILVMDNIDNLLEKCRSDLYKFIRLLQKSSNCQIITTSRISYSISELSTERVDVGEMKDEDCLELLKKHCSKQDDLFLQKLAELCGKIPLALCIAGSRVDDFDNPNELLRYLEMKPLKTLENPESNDYVDRAISSSYKMLTDEEKDVFVRLSVFKGSFSEEAAKNVIEKDNLDTKRIMKNLVSRSLIKQPTRRRYSIHLLIHHFLRHQQGDVDSAKRARVEATRAEQLMVEYYLSLGHDLTINSYSKDGYKNNREALKQEVHNIQNVLKICSQDNDTTTDCLTKSKIYTTSARFFSIFIRTIIPGSLVDEFLQRCVYLANERKEHGIKINFDCLIADQERSKTIGKSDECYITKMEEIESEFETQYEDLKEDQSLCAHYYSQYGRYLLRDAENCPGKKRLTKQVKAHEQFTKAFELREKITYKSVEIADKIFSLLSLGNVCKIITATKGCPKQEWTKQAQEHYTEATTLSKKHLGKHDLTSACYKSHGDFFFKTQNLNEAVEHYTIAKKMREDLGLNASKKHALLLNNLGQCLTKTNRVEEAIEVLENAREMAEKLVEGDEPNMCKAKIYTSLAIAYDSKKTRSEEAVKYAKKAQEFEGLEKIIGKSFQKLEKILSRNKWTMNVL